MLTYSHCALFLKKNASGSILATLASFSLTMYLGNHFTSLHQKHSHFVMAAEYCIIQMHHNSIKALQMVMKPEKTYSFKEKQTEKSSKFLFLLNSLFFFSSSLLTMEAKTQKSGNNDLQCLP